MTFTRKIVYTYMQLPTYRKIEIMHTLECYKEGDFKEGLQEMDKIFFKRLNKTNDGLIHLAVLLGIKPEQPILDNVDLPKFIELADSEEKKYSRERVLIYAKSYQLFVEREKPSEQEKEKWFKENVN